MDPFRVLLLAVLTLSVAKGFKTRLFSDRVGGSSRENEDFPVRRSASPGSPAPLRPLPSLADFRNDSSGALNGSFRISEGCTATVNKLDTTYQIAANPAACMNFAALLQLILSTEQGNFDMGSDFMILENIIISSLSYNTATREVTISAFYNSTLAIIPSLVSVSNAQFTFTFSSSHSDRWRLDAGASLVIGTVQINVRFLRNEQGYYLSASSDVSLNVSSIAHLFQTSNSFLPEGGLSSSLSNANFNIFAIENPRVKAVFTDGYGFLFGGQVRILTWKPVDVVVLINKVNDEPLAVTIAVYTSSFNISTVLQDLFGIDISNIPLLGSAEIRNLGLVISTKQVVTPLTLVDVGPSGTFILPYRQGIQVTFELLVVDVYVKIDIVLSTSELSLTVSQPGSLTLGRVIRTFLPDETANLLDSNNLIGWPGFIELNPLSISLTLFNIAVTRQRGSGWRLSNLEINLKMTQPIILFDNLITISNLQFNLAWSRSVSGTTSIRGLIAGTVSIGSNTTGVSPRVDIRIPFPFANQEITFTFTDFNIYNIATALGFTIPNDTFPDLLAQIQLDRIGLRFNREGSLDTVSVHASIPQLWNLFGSFSIGNIMLTFELDNIATGSKTWAFKISGEIRISSCTIVVSATLGSGLIRITANGTNCAVSISDILNAIHINPSILPSMITGFTISEPVFSFTYDRQINAKSVGFGATTSLFGTSDVEVALVSRGGRTSVVAGFAVRAVSDVPVLGFLDNLGLTDVAVMFVSQPVTLAPAYQWGKQVFNSYAPTTKQLPSGLTIYARFTPSEDNLMGKLLKQAGQAEITVRLTLPALIFEISIDLPNGGIPLGNSGGKFVGMGLVISRSLIGLNVCFALQRDNVNLTFRGDLTFTFGGTVTISLLMVGNWNEPFGIKRLAINRLGLALGINLATLFPSFGLTGEITVKPLGQPPLTAGITICLDTANPARTVFEIHFTRLLLIDIVNLFTTSSTAIVLPQKLAETGFPDEVHIFVSPAGNDNCFGTVYPAGVKIRGTFAVPFLQVRARADIEIGLDPFGLRADLQMDPINYGNGLLRIESAQSRNAGPYLQMNIGVGEFKINGSCRVVLFGASIAIQLEIDKTRLFFHGELNLWNLFRISLTVKLSLAPNNPMLLIEGLMQNDLFTRIRQRATAGIRAGARVIDQRIAAAQQKIRNAEREVDRLLGSIRYHERKIQEARNECYRAPWYRKWVCIGTGFRIIYHGVAIGGLWVAWGVARGVLWAARSFLDGVRFVIKVAAEVLTVLVNAALSIIDIQEIRLRVELSQTTRVFEFSSRIRVLQWTFTPRIRIDFSNSVTATAGINEAGDSVSKSTLDEVE